MAAGDAPLDPVWDDMERYVCVCLPPLSSALTDADRVTSGPSGNCSWQVNPPASTFWLDFLLIRSLDGL
jgi:hypothetical protein